MEKTIVGIDEVGYGAWAGPLAVAAVAIGEGVVNGLKDSKKIKEEKRYEIAAEILEKADFATVAFVSAEQIDEYGLSAAWTTAIENCVEMTENVENASFLLDGTNVPNISTKVSVQKSADDEVFQVSAASILAKAARDSVMIAIGKEFPAYGFDKHKGYGTALHKEMIEKFGVCPEHRKSFRPIKEKIVD